MTEIVYKVYDVVYPSPPPLREISSIAVAIQLWRLDLNKHLVNNTVQEFYTISQSNPNITLRDTIPDIPTIIEYLTEKYAKKLAFMTSEWLEYHFNCIFQYHRGNQNDILNDFNDIVGDYDGTIHYVRTAQRMMNCDKISQVEKFKIACLYSFEDDIKQIWPSVSDQINLDEVEFDYCPLLHYWVRCLRNELDKIPNEEGIPIDDLMLDNTSPENRSSFDYFWNRASLDVRYHKAIHLSMDRSISFCGRFILSKFSEEQLNKFIAERGNDLIFYVLTNIDHKEYVFPIWIYIKDKINEENFTSLMESMLSNETNYHFVDDPSIEKSEYTLKYHNNADLIICCEIWRTASPTLKRSAIQNLLTNDWLCQRSEIDPSHPREIRLLFTVVHDATLEERVEFWNTSWLDLLTSTRTSDIDRIMKLCFVNDEEIKEFKKNTMAKYENISETATEFFRQGYFNKLNDLLGFCCADIHSCNELKRQLLRSNFLGEDSVLSIRNISKVEAMLEFIDGAYDCNTGQANEFRNELMSSPGTEIQLLWCLRNDYFNRVKQFVDTFESRGETLKELKKLFVKKFKTDLMKGYVWFDTSKHLQEFLVWILGDEDQVTNFKQSISPDEVLRNMAQNQASKSDDDEPDQGTKMVKYPPCLDAFMLWYFDTPEKMNEFKTRLADVFEVFAPPTKKNY